MSLAWQLRIYEHRRLVHTAEGTGSLELGRQVVGEPGPFAETQNTAGRRLVIARLEDDSVSRKHVRIEPMSDGRFRLANLSQKLPIVLNGSTEVSPGGASEFVLPAVLNIGRWMIRVLLPEEQPPLQALPEVTLRPLADDMGHSSRKLPAPGMGAEQICEWLKGAMGVLQGVAGSRDFFARAARAMVDLVGLDSGRVLLLENGEWRVQGVQYAENMTWPTSWRPSRQVLARLVAEKRTFWSDPKSGLDAGQSLAGMDAVVAAPILNAAGDVIGALYGDRCLVPGLGGFAPVTRLEAHLVELLAGGVAAGLACLEQEQAAIRARVQFEQFFTPELSRQLEAEPDLLRGRDSEITVLFCDVRHFSRYAERLGPAKTVEWLADVMGALSECVLAHRGVLVDYIGDELMAMWGAPADQPDQASLAAAAALDMLAQAPALTARWATILGGPMGFGLGLNTGVARVGNTGTQRKFKYGPLGNSVNLASRVQGATKYLKAPLLVTRETHARLDRSVASRRVCQVRVVNIAEPVDLYELAQPGRPRWAELARGYESALAQFERRDLDGAMRTLFQLLSEYPDDGPALVLLSRVIALRDADPADFDPVWELPGK